MMQGLRHFGVDARLGRVPGELCDGEFSVNHSGRAKLVGTGQRITRAGYRFGAAIMVRNAAPAREALTAAYAPLGLSLNADRRVCRRCRAGCDQGGGPRTTAFHARHRSFHGAGRRGNVGAPDAPHTSEVHREKEK